MVAQTSGDLELASPPASQDWSPPRTGSPGNLSILEGGCICLAENKHWPSVCDLCLQLYSFADLLGAQPD